MIKYDNKIKTYYILYIYTISKSTMYPIDKSRVYYDLNISNLNIIKEGNPILKFSQTYGSEILKRPVDYSMSIIRFS